MSLLERFPTRALERAAMGILATDVVLTACGSSSVQAMLTIGRPGRWVALFALAAVSALLAARAWHGAPSRALTVLAVPCALLVVLALVSSAYSVEPRLTFERACSFALALVTAGLLGYACETSPGLPRRLLEGLAFGGLIVVLAGVAVYVFDHAAAVQAKRPGVPARWRGLGQNPNTVSMLAAVDLGIVLWLAVTAQRARLLWWFGVVCSVLTIFASGSRGAVLGGAIGALVIALFVPRRTTLRIAAAVVVLAVSAAGPVIVDAVAKPGGPNSGGTGAGGGVGGGAQIPPGARQFVSVGSSGRVAAWIRAYHTGKARPVLGYGFGTEEDVFNPRSPEFQGRRPESSFFGLFLQLGAVGVAFLVGLLGVLAWFSLRGMIRRSPDAVVVAAACGAAATLLFVESYVYSIGNVASLTFWVAAALAGARAS